jgi:hypothetical protein
VLRLIDAGEVWVGDKTRRPSQAAMKAIAGVLTEGDFYCDADRSEHDWDPAADLQMQVFAWPLLLQAAGLAEAAGSRLQLTAAGRKATTKPACEVVLQVWGKWQKTTLLEERPPAISFREKPSQIHGQHRCQRVDQGNPANGAYEVLVLQ